MARMISSKKSTFIPVGTILNHSIGGGCNSFYQVVKSSAKSVTVRQLQYKVLNRRIKWQTFDKAPKPNCFEPNESPFRLGVKLDQFGELQIGPIKRVMGWSIYDGEPRTQYSP